jgi:hypothetical protein
MRHDQTVCYSSPVPGHREEERDELDALGIVYRITGEWVHY